MSIDETSFDGDGLPPVDYLREQHRGQLRMAERFAIRYAEHFRYAHGLGWHRWDGSRWALDRDGAAKRAAVATLKAAGLDMLTLNGKDRDELYSDIRKCESSPGVNGMLELASILEPLSCAVDRLDSDPWLFNVANGTLDLHTGTVREHDPGDLITKLAGCGFSTDAAPAWEAFLDRVLPDPDVRGFVQRVLGYSLLGQVQEHVLPIFTGSGANGKGTLRDAVRHAFGDYSIEVDPTMLMESRSDRHTTELMDLRGTRLAFCSETDQGRRFAEAGMKRLVGGDPIRARRMRADPVEFQPSHTLVMLTNHLPRVSGDDPAVWRRLLAVPFDVVIPPEERDGTLSDQLRGEGPAVLGWLFEGWQAYGKQGLNPPAAVLAATQEYQAANDALGRYLDERVMVNRNMKVKARDLYLDYVRWCELTGEKDLTEPEFSESMHRRGHQKKRMKFGYAYAGLGLYADGQEEMHVVA